VVAPAQHAPTIAATARQKEDKMKTFTVEDFRNLDLYQVAMRRMREYGEIENTPEGWQAFIDANPKAWNTPLWVAWRLHKRGIIECPDLIWKIARIAFREQPECNAALRVWAHTLGPHNWQEAADAVISGGGSYEAWAAATHGYEAHMADTYEYDDEGATDAYIVAKAASSFREGVRAEIVALAVEALAALN
jgi:hypothetical protein